MVLIRGMDGWGWGALGMGCQWLAGLDGRGWGVGDGLLMVSRISLKGLSMRDMDGRGWEGGWGWVANG